MYHHFLALVLREDGVSKVGAERGAAHLVCLFCGVDVHVCGVDVPVCCMGVVICSSVPWLKSRVSTTRETEAPGLDGNRMKAKAYYCGGIRLISIINAVLGRRFQLERESRERDTVTFMPLFAYSSLFLGS